MSRTGFLDWWTAKWNKQCAGTGSSSQNCLALIRRQGDRQLFHCPGTLSAIQAFATLDHKIQEPTFNMLEGKASEIVSEVMSTCRQRSLSFFMSPAAQAALSHDSHFGEAESIQYYSNLDNCVHPPPHSPSSLAASMTLFLEEANKYGIKHSPQQILSAVVLRCKVLYTSHSPIHKALRDFTTKDRKKHLTCPSAVLIAVWQCWAMSGGITHTFRETELGKRELIESITIDPVRCIFHPTWTAGDATDQILIAAGITDQGDQIRKVWEITEQQNVLEFLPDYQVDNAGIARPRHNIYGVNRDKYYFIRAFAEDEKLCEGTPADQVEHFFKLALQIKLFSALTTSCQLSHSALMEKQTKSDHLIYKNLSWRAKIGLAQYKLVQIVTNRIAAARDSHSLGSHTINDIMDFLRTQPSSSDPNGNVVKSKMEISKSVATLKSNVNAVGASSSTGDSSSSSGAQGHYMVRELAGSLKSQADKDKVDHTAGSFSITEKQAGNITKYKSAEASNGWPIDEKGYPIGCQSCYMQTNPTAPGHHNQQCGLNSSTKNNLRKQFLESRVGKAWKKDFDSRNRPGGRAKSNATSSSPKPGQLMTSPSITSPSTESSNSSEIATIKTQIADLTSKWNAAAKSGTHSGTIDD
eukprot:g3760.t1